MDKTKPTPINEHLNSFRRVQERLGYDFLYQKFIDSKSLFSGWVFDPLKHESEVLDSLIKYHSTLTMSARNNQASFLHGVAIIGPEGHFIKTNNLECFNVIFSHAVCDYWDFKAGSEDLGLTVEEEMELEQSQGGLTVKDIRKKSNIADADRPYQIPLAWKDRNQCRYYVRRGELGQELSRAVFLPIVVDGKYLVGGVCHFSKGREIIEEDYEYLSLLRDLVQPLAVQAYKLETLSPED